MTYTKVKIVTVIIIANVLGDQLSEAPGTGAGEHLPSGPVFMKLRFCLEGSKVGLTCTKQRVGWLLVEQLLKCQRLSQQCSG